MSNTYVKTILILAANPTSTSRLRLDEEVREIDEGLRRANKRAEFKLEQKWAVRQRDFYRAMLDCQPQIVHFCGHGAGEDGIVLNDEMGQPALISADALGSMFKLFATKGVDCVLLNACYSLVQAEAISQHVNYVIGMNSTVGDKAAVAFAVAFYDAIAAGEEVEFAYELSCSQMIGFLEQQTPVLRKKQLIIPIAPQTEVIPPNPYQALSAFGEEDAAFFFGRETFVNSLVQATRSQPLVAVIGPSGSGKSSVVFAGLIPQLRGEGNWLIESFRPSHQPFYQLASALVRQLEPEIGETEKLRSAVGLAADIQQGKVTLQQVVSCIIERNSDKRLLLVADQFEELYTLCQVKEEQECFADTLLAVIQEGNLTLVLTLRADFLDDMLSHRPFRDVLQQFTPQFLSSMRREELQAAIELPAKKLEVQLDSHLTQRILDDVGQEPGNLPLLEFALTRLWEKQQNRVLTHQAYDEIGGVNKAIANHAEQVYQKLSENLQQQAQRIFLQLVHPGEGTEDTRRIATRAEVGENNWELVIYLAGYQTRLVVTRRNELDDTVEMVHEALIREWGTLREWINANRQFRTWQERLKIALREWKNNNHDSGALLRGAPLAVAEDWLQKRTEEMTQAERDFIQASVQNRNRERAERERRRRLTFLGLVGGLIGALSLAGFAGWQWRQAEKLAIIARIGENAATVRNMLPTEPLDALVLAIQSTGESQDKLKQVLPQVQSSLYDAIGVARERYSFKDLHNWFYSVAISPDGKTIVTVSAYDNAVRLWNLEGDPIGKPLKGFDEASSVAFSPNSQTIAVSRGNIVELWNLKGNLIGKPFKGHEGIVTSVAFSPDGYIVSGSKDKTVRLWDIKGNPIGKPFKGHKDGINSVAFSPDEKYIVSGSDDNTVLLWDLKGNSVGSPFKGHKKFVTSVAFSPKGKYIVSGSDDNTVRLWDLKGNLIGDPFKGHESRVKSVAFSPNGKYIVSGSFDNTVRLWNLNGKPIGEPLKGRYYITSLAITPDGKTIVTVGSHYSTVRLWDFEGNFFGQPFEGHNYSVNPVAFSPDGKYIVSGGYDNTVRLWDIKGNPIGKPFKGHEGVVNSVAFSADGKYIVSGSGDNTVRLWNIKGNPIGKPFKGHKGGINSVAFSPDGKYIVSGSGEISPGNGDFTVRLWDLNGNPIGSPFKGHNYSVNSVAFSPDGKYIVSGGDFTVRLWDLNGNPIGKPFEGHEGVVTSVAFSPDGKYIISGGYDNTVRLWDIKGNPIGKPFKGHEDAVTSVAFSPDSKYIVSGGNDRKVRLWDLNGNPIGSPFKGHEDGIKSVAFSRDQKYIVSASSDNILRLWRGGNWQDWLKVGCNRLRFHPVLVDAQTEETKAAGETCQKYVWSDIEKAQFLVKQGQARAQEGDLKEAEAKFKQAQTLDSSVVIPAETEVKHLAANGLIKKGEDFVNEGKVKEALGAYTEAQKLAPNLKITADSWNHLCWAGSLHGHATEVMFACEKAVLLEPENGNIRNSRGVARALTGDKKGAIEDFEAYIKSTNEHKEKAQRQRWIDALRAGESPFTEEEIKRLLNE